MNRSPTSKSPRALQSNLSNYAHNSSSNQYNHPVPLELKFSGSLTSPKSGASTVSPLTETHNIIGSDECLKGDTFGGLVVAALKTTSPEQRQRLEKIGVADSKKLTDAKIHQLSKILKSEFPCSVISLLPEQYNSLTGDPLRNMTTVLNSLHSQVAADLHPGFHIVDEYPGCTIGDLHEPRAESKYPEVAAASILARSAALDQLDFLSRIAGFAIPKGSTHVTSALEMLKSKNLTPTHFVKLNFKNVEKFFTR